MKTKFFMIIVAAGLGLAGCSASKEGQSDTDSMVADSTMADSTLQTGSTATDTTAVPDSTRQDTMRQRP